MRIPLTYLAAFTGVRRNEALALRFDDIDWFTNEVNMRQAISKRRRKDGGQKWEWHVGPPKSRKSARRIAATESVMKMLAELKVGKAGAAFVFPGNCSGFIDPDMFDAEVWKPIAQKAGMPGTRFHDLRHFFASQLIANGETAAYVRDQMGHSASMSPSTPTATCFRAGGRKRVTAYEKAMRDAREKSNADVRKTFAIEGEEKGGAMQPIEKAWLRGHATYRTRFSCLSALN